MTFSGRDFFIQSLLFWYASSGSSQGSSASSSSLSGGVGVRASSAVFILPRTAARILEQTLQVQTSSSLRASSLDGPGRGEGGAGVEEVAETSPSAIVTTLGGGGLSLILSLMERSERGGELLVPRLVEGEGEVVRVGDGEGGGGGGALLCGGCCGGGVAGGGATVWQTTKGSASPSPRSTSSSLWATLRNQPSNVCCLQRRIPLLRIFLRIWFRRSTAWCWTCLACRSSRCGSPGLGAGWSSSGLRRWALWEGRLPRPPGPLPWRVLAPRGWGGL